MDEGEEGRSELVVAGGYSTPVFELIKKPFDEVALFVEMCVVVALVFSIGFGWDNGVGTGLDNVICVVTLIGDKRFNSQAFEKGQRLRVVTVLTGGKYEA